MGEKLRDAKRSGYDDLGRSCCGEGLAFRLFSVRPNGRYNTAISACARASQTGQALRVLQRMQQVGIEPDVRPFPATTSGRSGGREEQCVRHFGTTAVFQNGSDTSSGMVPAVLSIHFRCDAMRYWEYTFFVLNPSELVLETFWPALEAVGEGLRC